MGKMGRPKVVSPRLKSVGVRLTEEEYNKLKKYASEHNLTITELILQGIQLLLSKS
jgi:hypothetical protein